MNPKKSKMENVIGGKTLGEIDKRIPNAFRLAFGISYRASPPGEHDDVASFAAAFLPTLDDSVSDPMECDKEEPPRDLRMEFESCYLPDHNEDAHFVHARTGVIGVADGVGGYRGTGVDAPAFARGLMRNAHQEAAAATPGTHVCPLVPLELAHHRTVLSRTPAASTAVIHSLAGRALSSGRTSATAVLRDGRILYRSSRSNNSSTAPCSSTPHVAPQSPTQRGKVPAKEGDVVLVGTDGLFDNVWDDELERIVRTGTAMGYSPMAEAIAASVHETATCRYKDMPYSVEKLKHQGTATTGGKPDDITVVVAFIVSYD